MKLLKYQGYAVLFLLAVCATNAESGWAGKALSFFKDSADEEVLSGGFEDAAELSKAIREALAVSAERALTELGQSGGFTNSEAYRIPLPKSVEKFRKPLAIVKQDHLLNNFQTTMNEGAEAAVAAAPGIVKNAINNLTLEDLNLLWKGEDDAITRFLENQSRDTLSQKMEPIIAKATDASGATKSYKNMLDAIPESGGGLFSKIQSFTGVSSDDFDLDSYVNEKALDALFSAMAAEEKSIREDPLARTTDLLKKLFTE
ncbi:MAG: DUF4197 domain-containing protein [Verrucomicrobiota bacterium]